jgi:hypothetical protein
MAMVTVFSRRGDAVTVLLNDFPPSTLFSILILLFCRMASILETHRDLGHGDTDDICQWCSRWCVSQTMCSNRYNMMHGEWVDAPPPHPSLAPDDNGTAMVPFCDQCGHGLKLLDTSGDVVMVVGVGRRFHVEAVMRVND